jgi:uncharacterized SAM-binding protein YcdF (DUF218 family)
MFFWVKKLIGYWLMPVPFCLAMLLAGVVLMRTQRRARVGRGLVTAAAVLLVLFANKLVSASLLRPLEFTYPAIPELAAGAPVPPALAQCRYVLVLGGGNAYTPGRPALSRLSSSALGRIAEAVRLLRVLPEAKLVLCGPPNGDNPSHASVLARSAISLGLDPQRIVLIEQVRDTEDESLAALARIGAEPFALVTSAWHMPRSVALFRHAGMNPLPCPADFIAHDDGRWHWRDLLWDVESLERSTWAIRERLGLVWIGLRGKT